MSALICFVRVCVVYPLTRLYAAAGVPSLHAILDSARLTRLGHVARMPDTSIVKQLCFATSFVGEDIPQGRPRTTWLKTALGALDRVEEGASHGDWVGRAQDRQAWRSLCQYPLRRFDLPA